MLPAAALATVAVRGDFHIPLHRRDRHAARLKESVPVGAASRGLSRRANFKAYPPPPAVRVARAGARSTNVSEQAVTPLLPFRALFERVKQFCWHHWLE